MSTIEDQPPPKPTALRPIWETVIEYTKAVYPPASEDETVRNVLADMAERHGVGIARYGTPLTPQNGRNSLVDAYQERLDLVAYTANELANRGLDVAAVVAESAKTQTMPDLNGFSEDTQKLFSLFINDVAFLALMRELIDTKPS